MSSINMKMIEKNIYQAYFADGVWDLMIGLIFLSAGLGVWVDQAFWYAFPILVLGLPLVIKRWITFPRTGHTALKSKTRAWVGFVVFIVEAAALALLFYLGSRRGADSALSQWFLQNLFLSLGIFVALCLVILAGVLYFPRLYLYAGIVMLAAFSIHRLLTVGAAITLAGVLIILISLFVMRNFTRHHPVVSRS